MAKRFYYLVVVLALLLNIEVSGQEIAVGKFVENKAIKSLSDISFKREESVLTFSKESPVNRLNQYAIVPVNLLTSSMKETRIHPLQNSSYTQKLSFFAGKNGNLKKLLSSLCGSGWVRWNTLTTWRKNPMQFVRNNFFEMDDFPVSLSESNEI